MKIKKYLIVLLLIVFITPSVALASWWNPASWKIFNFLHKKQNSTQIDESKQKSYEDTISELQKQIEDLKSQQSSSTPSSPSMTADEIKAQIEKEVKSKIDQNTESNREKTLSEQVGVTKEKFQACVASTDKTVLQAKINESVESAMKAVPPEQRGTPYAVIIGSNGVKTEIRGADSYENVKKVIDEVKAGKVTNEYKGEVALTETGDHLSGSANAQVKIIEYSDFECPYCKIFHATLKKIVADSSGSVSWVYRHWPIHSGSFEKLVASECVAKLKGNDAFWKYIDLIFDLIKTGNESVADKL